MKVPYVNEALTRKIKKAASRSGIPIRVVTTSGRTVKDEVKAALSRRLAPPPPCSCELHQADIPCQQRNVVYKATCRRCGEDYIGGTGRPLSARVVEHERSQRLGNTKSALGRHLTKEHPEAVTKRRRKRGRPGEKEIEERETDYKIFFENFDFRVVGRGRDVLETFLRENMKIQRENPALNNCQTNGFIF